jgi:hypothetical protein
MQKSYPFLGKPGIPGLERVYPQFEVGHLLFAREPREQGEPPVMARVAAVPPEKNAREPREPKAVVKLSAFHAFFSPKFLPH